MKTNKNEKKLVLNKTIVVQLDNDKMNGIKAGDFETLPIDTFSATILTIWNPGMYC